MKEGKKGGACMGEMINAKFRPERKRIFRRPKH
jgi:hypothetical protein